jgi:acetyl esterase/lipase
MKLPRILRTVLWVFGTVILLLALVVGAVWWYFHPAHRRVDAITYAQRHGRDLTFEIVYPARPNGLGVILMVSGGWKSSPGSFRPFMVAPLLRRGYTVFAVSHLSQPKATVMEIAEDAHRAVRFIRHRAKEYGIDPQRLAVTGGSAGGHLSLLLATRGEPGPAEASDPIDRESSAVQAVAIFYPVTDLLNLGKSTENPGDGGPPRSFVKAFGPQSTNLAVWKVIGRETSPIYYVHSNMPPVLIFHGDADTLTPLEQSLWFQARGREMGRTVEIVVRPGQKHGWLTMLLDVRKFADWFDRYLRPSTN